MGLFSSKKWTPADEAEDQRAIAKESAALARAAKAVGANKIADRARRHAAQSNVVARYMETGRCQLGHKNCQDGDH